MGIFIFAVVLIIGIVGFRLLVNWLKQKPERGKPAGLVLMIVGVLVCFTIFGMIIGIPMIIFGATLFYRTKSNA